MSVLSPHDLHLHVSIFKERWIQPELYDCEVMGHDWELQEYITGYTGTLKWTCLMCEEVYDGERV